MFYAQSAGAVIDEFQCIKSQYRGTAVEPARNKHCPTGQPEAVVEDRWSSSGIVFSSEVNFMAVQRYALRASTYHVLCSNTEPQVTVIYPTSLVGIMDFTYITEALKDTKTILYHFLGSVSSSYN